MLKYVPGLVAQAVDTTMRRLSFYLVGSILSTVACGARTGLNSLSASASAAGGTNAAGDLPSSGGLMSTGGSKSTGSATALGGAGATGGVSATGGTPSTGGSANTKIVAKAVAAGDSFACALESGGTVRCWGRNNYGQLGNSFTGTCFSGPCSVTPVAVSGITNATAIAAGDRHACALLSDGVVQCWGRNDYGQLGNGTTMDSSVPVTVAGITDATSVAAASSLHACALLAVGTVQCWGDNANGELGNGTTTSSAVPVTVAGISDAMIVSAGSAHACALLSGGQLQCWGDNEYGELGNGSMLTTFPLGISTPVTVSGISNATAIAAGFEETCALLSTGSVQCWGYNSDGQLGDGTTMSSSLPVTVSGF